MKRLALILLLLIAIRGWSLDIESYYKIEPLQTWAFNQQESGTIFLMPAVNSSQMKKVFDTEKALLDCLANQERIIQNQAMIVSNQQILASNQRKIWQKIWCMDWGVKWEDESEKLKKMDLEIKEKQKKYKQLEEEMKSGELKPLEFKGKIK